MTTIAPPELMTTSDVARSIGVHERTLQRWAADGRVPAHRLGDRLVFTAEDVAQILGVR